MRRDGTFASSVLEWQFTSRKTRFPSRGLHPDASDASEPPSCSESPKRRRRDGHDYCSNFKHYNQGPGERVASWADPLSRVEINFHFYGAFRRMLLPPSMLMICKNIFHHGFISARGFHPALFCLLSAALSLGRLPTYIARKPDPGSQRQSKQGETRGTDARPAAF